ncbi:Nucleotide pyrophosphohydrolase [Acidilobus saccharovorans 345-15]|uniref:Nucleotide pyrophosphohydrolase n=1 Tax=Acidilobus saccharovorans (strain DSM 16705 / JCM 18335 / VKM B-2471 / 345-15) TaxID=666510 RepID=D9Q2B3_ACIS3|nr:MazG nucleotide pyrophosphohydrolase domain-containing protein [Acidilobus saccharovorans]ADL19451.1 Nucleotide pyrophosphohydrolase [Acidilobus saccharovorans 345-15]
MELRCVQRAMKDEYFNRDSERGLFPTFAWFVEEVGELGEALLKRDKSGISEELADVIAWAISIANLLDIDVEEALRGKYGQELAKAGCCEGVKS